MAFFHLHRNIQIRMVNSFLSNLLGNMLFPFMTIYFAQKFGAELTGLLLIVNVAVGLLANFYGGYVSDKYGRRKVLLAGESVRLLSFAMMALANSPWWDSAAVTFLMMTLNSLCWGLTGPANEAMLIDVSTSENRKFIYSVGYWSMNFSLVVGGLAGGFLFQEYRSELFAGVALMQVVTVSLVAFFIKETYVPKPSACKTCQGKVWREMMFNYKIVFQDKVYVVFILASIFVSAVERMGLSYTGVRLEAEMGAQSFLSLPLDGVKMFGFLSAENSLLVVVLAVFVTRFLKKLSDKRAMVLGILLYSAGFAVLAVSNSPAVLLLFMAVATLGELIWVPSKQALQADLAPAENRSAYMAVNGLAYRGAAILGSLAVSAGAFLPSLLMGGLFGLSGLVGLFFILYTLRVRNQKSVQEILSSGHGQIKNVG